MNPRLVEQVCEQIKGHLARAKQHEDAGDERLMRAEAETAVALFRPIMNEAGDPLRMLGPIRKTMRSLGYSEEEFDNLLSGVYSSTTMKKDNKDAKPPHVQPPYIKPPDTLPGFPNALPVPKKGGRKRWRDKKAKRIYEWDSQHGHVEGWDNTGKKHQGAFDPNDGTQVKPPDPKKKPITPEIVTPMKKKERYALAWYSVEDEALVGEEDVRLSQDTVRKWFFLPEEDSAVECYDVTASQRKHLMKLVDEKINLNKYIYQLEGRAEE